MIFSRHLLPGAKIGATFLSPNRNGSLQWRHIDSPPPRKFKIFHNSACTRCSSGGIASTRMRSHQISNRVLASPEGIARCGVVTFTPMTGLPPSRGVEPWPVMAVRTPTLVPELLSCTFKTSELLS
ncbi:hypothetical protein AVEN_61998-1 [Araneus ventricosus]|uniref:Uncharacterized protein n=1 Tax=Araneus ventricosus TaxID=182803 RepID=A0A4Y2ED96_ARAVE|nr:hypothetical protein AVEN_61998-1 [Araneus ventricosus]